MSSPASSMPRAAGTVAPHNVTPLYSPQQQPLLAQPPRSSSLPFSSLHMGSSQSKPAPSTPSSSSYASSSGSSAVKGITAVAVNGGNKLKRAFAARRKKSEDTSSLFASTKGKEPEAAAAPVRAATAARAGADGQALSSQVADRSSSVPPPLSLSSQQPQRMDTTSTSPATSPSPRSQVFNKNVASPVLPSPPPPTPPPKKEMPPSTSAASLQPDVRDTQVLSAAGNRNSIIPISPGISSAVNYLSLIDQQQQSSHPQPPSQPQNTGGTANNLTSKSDPSMEKEILHASTSSRGSIERKEKESWRKSDSTNSHHTIKPSTGSARTSRPASWAESFQSAYTVVQPGTTSRPMSALMADSEFPTLEEDDGDSSEELPESSASSSASHAQSSQESGKERDAKSSAAQAKSKRNRRSMSLSVATPSSSSAAAVKQAAVIVPQPPPSASALETGMTFTSSSKIHPSMSITEGIPPSGVYKVPRSPPAISTAASQPQGKFVSSPPGHPNFKGSNNNSSAYLQHERSLPALPQHPHYSYSQQAMPSSQNHPRSSSLHPHPSGQTYAQGQTATPSRTPAISMTAGGLGPAAAGLAKKAVEKMNIGKKWMGLALSHSASGGHNVLHHAHEQSTSEGYSSSSSTSGSMNQGEYPGGGGFGFNLARTSSNTSASGTSSSHHHHRHHSFFSPSPSKAIVPGGGAGAHKRTQNATSSMSSSLSGSESDPFYQDGPILGRKLRGPLGVAASSSGMTRSQSQAQMKGWVFRRDLASCTRDTRPTPGVGVRRRSEAELEGLSEKEREREVLIRELEERALPALVVRCAQHLLLWGVKEEGLFRVSGRPSHAELEGLSEKEREREVLIRELEERALPALVVRCAQHLLLWGVKEEGLFRVSGRPSHVSRLRAEFDSGADYDMTECTPGDLDPHAVAGVFRAYLRELPEPILTQKLQPYFDAAISKEASTNAPETGSANPARMSMVMGAGPGRPIVGLPSGPKSGFNTHASGSMSISNPIGLRKPPSLSTLAMPSFSVPPPSLSLTAALKKLVAQLPQENRDLIRTIVELIQATSKEVKETKMPLSNLLVVFTPSLNMSPSLLRALCEAEGIWVDQERVIDIRRRTVIVGPSPDVVREVEVEDKESVDESDVEEEESVISGRASLDTTDNSLSSDYHASVEDDTSSSLSMSVPTQPEEDEVDVPRLRHGSDYQRAEVPTVYLSTKSHCSTASSISYRDGEDQEEDEDEGEQVPTATPHVDTFAGRDRDYQHRKQGPYMAMADDTMSMLSTSSSPPGPPLLSSSAESVVTPTSSGNSSLADLVNVDKQPEQQKKEDDDGAVGPPQIAEPTDLELRPQSLAGSVVFPSQQSQPDIKLQLPAASASSTSLAVKRRSIPTLSMPSLPPPAVAYAPSPSSAPTPSSASPSYKSFSDKEKDTEKKMLRSKKPSLKLLFSKRSASSLQTGKEKESGAGWDRASTGMPFISNPTPLQQQPSPAPTPLQQLYAMYARNSPRSASDSSVSTPLSAVTAPQSSLPGSIAPSRSTSTAGSSSNFPPVLDTPIEGPSLSIDYGFDVSPPRTATVEDMSKAQADASASEKPPITPEPRPEVEHHAATSTRRPVMGRTGMQAQLNLPTVEPLFIKRKEKGASVKEAPAPALRAQASTSNLSIASTSSNHLNMFDDAGDGEDWTQSVLLAADVDGSWSIQRGGGGATTGVAGVGSSSNRP
ncbi:hypothetical protein CVT26_013664 [Gymnopilus dilepis]|uniref:Rho-GAP domain-containing protein n=1 Tax=Gymnopilus dilepis TaxID=231916 RepID=A0A409YWH6_9AGAR|nr:hypothetical protein CVT26_013664 [Gymnopilus dilepis]